MVLLSVVFSLAISSAGNFISMQMQVVDWSFFEMNSISSNSLICVKISVWSLVLIIFLLPHQELTALPRCLESYKTCTTLKTHINHNPDKPSQDKYVESPLICLLATCANPEFFWIFQVVLQKHTRVVSLGSFLTILLLSRLTLTCERFETP